MKLPVRVVRRAIAERSCSGTHTLLRPSPALRSSPPTPGDNHQPWRCRHISKTSLKRDARTVSPPAADEAHEPQVLAPTTKSSSSSRSISEQVRLLMRRVPYPVAIITATDPAGPADANPFRGMTISSFNTVTLTPHPVISFNVRRPSETLSALLASGRFLVHLLSPSAATATLARDFSKGNTTLTSVMHGQGAFEFGALAAADSSDGDLPLPILRRRKAETSSSKQHREEGPCATSERAGLDFPFVFECTLHPHKIDIHDHSIVLGTVVRAIQGDAAFPKKGSDGNASGEQSSDRLCLTYADTRFWKMGSGI